MSTYQGYRAYPTREQQAEIKNLLLRVGIAPTRSIMNRVKSLNEEQALRAKDILTRAATAAEYARRHHPDGKRSSAKQLSDWERWMNSAARDVTPEALANFLNLDTKTANSEIMSLRFIVWGERDAAGRTSRMRAARGLVTEHFTPGEQQPRRLTLDQL